LIISDINLLSIIKSNNPLISIFGKVIIPIINLNIFLHYLVKNGGYKASFLGRLIILLPNLLIGITPDYDWLAFILFSISFPFAAYLIIDYLIIKKTKEMPTRISKKYEPMHNVILFAFIGLLIIFVLDFFPLKPLTVMSNSMSPYFDVGYIVLVEDIDYDSIKVGDIVEYKNNQNIMIIHRVVQIYVDNGIKKMIFKGDNNENIDSKPVIENQIIGRLKYRIPYVGYPSYLFKRIMGILIEKVLYGGHYE
jgi:signal peptidase